MAVCCSSFIFTLRVKQFQCNTILMNTSLTFSCFSSKNVLWSRPEVRPLRSPHPRLLSLCREATASNCSSNTHWNPRPPPHPFKDSWKTLATWGDTKQYSKARTFLKMTQYQQTPRSGHLSKAKLTALKSKSGEILSRHETSFSLLYFGYSLSPFD